MYQDILLSLRYFLLYEKLSAETEEAILFDMIHFGKFAGLRKERFANGIGYMKRESQFWKGMGCNFQVIERVVVFLFLVDTGRTFLYFGESLKISR